MDEMDEILTVWWFKNQVERKPKKKEDRVRGSQVKLIRGMRGLSPTVCITVKEERNLDEDRIQRWVHVTSFNHHHHRESECGCGWVCEVPRRMTSISPSVKEVTVHTLGKIEFYQDSGLILYNSILILFFQTSSWFWLIPCLSSVKLFSLDLHSSVGPDSIFKTLNQKP